MWGQVCRVQSIARFFGIIPTRVGTRFLLNFMLSQDKDHPHACGDKIISATVRRNSVGSSPRVWGQGLTPHTLGSVVPIIPTRVGTRLLLSFLSSSGTYHPHACGDKLYHRIFDLSRGGSVDYNIKCNTKKYGHHTHFRVKCNYHKTKDTEVEYEVLYTFYTI